MEKIILATKNEGKVIEFRRLFSAYGIVVKSLLDFDEKLEDIEEYGTTFSQNAIIKAEAISSHFQVPVIADDSGIVIDALDGAPGVYSARYAGEEKNDKKNLEKVLQELEGVSKEQRTARFVCAIAVARPNQKTFTELGTCEGFITSEPRGDHGFGYDPIFVPKDFDRTMAELESEEKNSISHRNHAILKVKKWLQNESLRGD